MRLSIFKDNLGCNCHYFFKGEPIFTTLPRSRLFTFLRPMSRVACDGVSSKCKHQKPMISPSPRQTSTASDPAKFVFYGRGQKSRRGRRCISIKKRTRDRRRKTRQRSFYLRSRLCVCHKTVDGTSDGLLRSAAACLPAGIYFWRMIQARSPLKTKKLQKNDPEVEHRNIMET